MAKQCKAMVLTQYLGGKARCKRRTKEKYCYQHKFLETYSGYYIDRLFNNGIVV